MVIFNNGFDERKAKAGSSHIVLIGGFSAIEFFENALAVL